MIKGLPIYFNLNFSKQLIIVKMNYKSILRSFLYYLILILNTTNVKCTLNSVSVTPLTVSSIATYTWSINLTASPFSPLTLIFPTQVSMLNNQTVTINGATAIFNRSANTIIITSLIVSSVLSVIVTNVQNPPSAISSSSFSYSTVAEDTKSLALIRQIKYQTGMLSSCPWSFNLCTQQPGSDLIISFTTVNKILSVNNYFLIGYALIWPNHQSKGLLTGVSTINCSYSMNASVFLPAISCTIDNVNNQIVFLFSVSSQIGSGTSIVVKIGGVISPPTKIVPTSTFYSIFTADSSQNKIDGLSNCAFNNVCVTNQTNGTFSGNPSMIINQKVDNPTLQFSTVPFIITVKASDSIDIYYSSMSSLLSCKTFNFYRSGTEVYSTSSLAVSSNYITFTLPSITTNNEFNFPFLLYLSCQSFLLPSSQTPTTLSFIFKRNSIQYLQLNTTVKASATTFNNSQATLNLSSTSMASVSTLTLNFILGQPLGSNPAIKISFPADFAFGNIICDISILGINITSTSFSVNNSKIAVELTALSSLPSGSNLILTIQGLINPTYLKTYFLGIDTYYDSTISTSLVESSPSAFTTTITQIENYPVVLTPSSLIVSSQTNIVLTFTSTIPIPLLSMFQLQFPSDVSSINPNASILLSVDGSPKPLSGAIRTNTSINSVSFVSGSNITIGSIVRITIPLMTPSIIGIYSFVKLIVSNNSTNYLSSKNSLSLNVDSFNSMITTMTPVTRITGSVSDYILTLYLTIPHSSTFAVQIDVPSDTSFIQANANCSNCSSISLINSTSFEFIANNPKGNASTSISFNLKSFKNPRAVGPSLLWGISTKTIFPSSIISYQTAFALINTPSILTAMLSRSDVYYRNNTNPVKMTFTFTNQLIDGDYIQLYTTSDIYRPVNTSSVKCSSIYGQCSLLSSYNTTIIKIKPNMTSIINNTLSVMLQGVISGSNSTYSSIYNYTVTTMTSNSSVIDSGIMIYNVSCRQNSTKNCKRCQSNGNCIDCYYSIGYYLQGNSCILICPNRAVNPITGVCECKSECLTCSDYSICITCMNSSYLVLNGSCVSQCPVATVEYRGQCNLCSLGCVNCTINNCLSCQNGSYLYNNLCHSDCNLISLQYDSYNNSCILCPVGCDSCSATSCNSCLSGYIISNRKCNKLCFMSYTCEKTQKIYFLISLVILVIWCIICIYMKNIKKRSILFLKGSQLVINPLILFIIFLAISHGLSQIDQINQIIWAWIVTIVMKICINITVLIIYNCCLDQEQQNTFITKRILISFLFLIFNFRFGFLCIYNDLFPKSQKSQVETNQKQNKNWKIIYYLSFVCDLSTLVAGIVSFINFQNSPSVLSLDLIVSIFLNFIIIMWLFTSQNNSIMHLNTTNRSEYMKNSRNDTVYKQEKNDGLIINFQTIQDINQKTEPIKQTNINFDECIEQAQ